MPDKFLVQHPLTGAWLSGFSYPENRWPQTDPIPVWTGDRSKAARYDEQQVQWAAREVADHLAKSDPLAMLFVGLLG
jgi:hypothetical protein